MSGYFGGGGDGALVIDSNHVFDDTSARDAYFSANPGELEDGIVIQVGALFQRRVGSDWVDVTAIVRGPAGSAGAAGAAGADGTDGDNGWTPIFATASDGERRVLRVIDWTGGEGTKPTTGQYVGPSGLVASIGDGVDIRGSQGAEGAAGTDPNNLGFYATAIDLTTAHPTGDAGQFAVVGETDTVWVWSVSGSEWINTGASGAVVSLQGLTGALTFAGVGIGVTADGTVITLTNSDSGSAAVGTHEGTYSHADIASNTSARHTHTNKATLDAIPNHATASEGQAVIRQGDGTLAWDDISSGSTGFKGHYTTPEQLASAIPTGQAGWYAIVGSTDTVWVWDTDGEAWVDTDTKGEVSSVNSQTGDVVIKAGDGVTVGLDGAEIEVTNADRGSIAVTAHTNDIDHTPLADVAGKVAKAGDTMTGTIQTPRVVVPEKAAAADPASTFGAADEHVSAGVSQVDIFGDDTYGYSHCVRLIDKSPMNANNAWLHMYNSNNQHMFEANYTGSTSTGTIILRDIGEAIKARWQWGADADTYFHFGAGSAIDGMKVSVNGAIGVTSGNPIYMRGDADTDGSVRIVSDAAGVFKAQERESGSWVDIDLGGGGVPDEIKTDQLPLFVPGTITDTESDPRGDAFEDANGAAYIYHGPTCTVEELHAHLGTVDTGVAQPTLQVYIDGTALLTSAQSFGSTANTDTNMTSAIDGSNKTLTKGDRIEIFTEAGTEGDAATAVISLVRKTSEV